MQNLTGKTIDRYHILEQIGEGGMAVVYKAYDTRLEREVAIKIIRKEAFPPEALDRIFKRFEREAKSLARLSHPNIIKVHDYGEYEGSPYLVMEYQPGGTLKGLLGRPLPWKEVSKYIIPLAEALGYAHQQGILHRDVKPSNILITTQGEPMLTDFGIAKILDMSEGQTLTGTGIGVGTPEYMAPEQGLGKEVDGRVDIYSLGVILYELVTGRKPYAADTPMAVLFKHMTDPLPRPGEVLPGIPDDLEKVILKCLAKDPANRYQSMAELVSAMEKVAKKGEESNKTVTQPKSPPIRNPDNDTGANLLKKNKWNKNPLIFIGGGILVLLLIVLVGGKGPFSSGKTKSIQTQTITKEFAAIQGLTTQTSSPQNDQEITAVSPNYRRTPTLDIKTPKQIQNIPSAGETYGSSYDRMIMVYIQGGEFFVPDSIGNSLNIGNYTAHLNSFWLDQTEITNAMYQYCVENYACTPPQNISSNKHKNYYGNETYADHPVIYVTYSQAVDYCKKVNRRLATADELLFAAYGEQSTYRFPWGESISSDFANFGNSKGDTMPVMSFPDQKVNKFGVYDLLGNVWEWTSEHTYTGGSWNSEKFMLGRIFNDDYMSYDSKRNDLGFRCAQSFENYDSNNFVLLNKLQKDGMEMVYVPAGDFVMGSNDGYADEKPVHTIYLDSYWIDKYEVTNLMYQQCVNDGGCDQNTDYGSDFNGEQQPVVGVNWNQAKAYCGWASRELPTEAQWEKAARGTDGRTYPWGEGADSTKAYYDPKAGKTTHVGFYPEGASPYGALDMAGNVWEWVADWYSESYYAISPSTNPVGPDLGTSRVLRGGSWYDDSYGVRSTYRLRYVPSRSDNYIGFRCALSLP